MRPFALIHLLSPVAARFVLSGLPPAVAAFSGRRLTDLYRGPALRVRRASDNAEADIGFIADGSLDETALLTHAGSGDGYVVKVYDQSGNARDLAQSTAANQPRIVLAGTIDRINTRPALRTDGVSQLMATGSFVLAQPFTRASVIQFLNPGSGSFLNALSGNTGGADLYTHSGTLSTLGGTFKTGLAANDKAAIVEVANGASGLASYNGTVTNLNMGANSMTGLTLARPGTFSGLFGDIILFDKALSATDRQALEADQKRFYGL